MFKNCPCNPVQCKWFKGESVFIIKFKQDELYGFYIMFNCVHFTCYGEEGGLYKYKSVLKLSNLTRNLSLTNVENILILSENTLF